MKFIKASLLLLLFIICPQLHQAQNAIQKKEITKNYNTSTLKKLSKTLAKQQEQRKKELTKYALKHNIDLVIKKPGGGISILEEVLEDGSLIYITTFNEGAAKTLNTQKLYTGNELNLNLSGAGIEIGMWDGEKARTTHQELENRIVYIDNPEEIDFHPTHVAGTLIASGINPEAKGMAPASSILGYDFNDNLNEIAAASQNGMLLSNHSYGFGPANLDEWVFGAYVGQSRVTDEIAFQAPFHLMVFAAGNSNNQDFNEEKNGYDLITGYNLSKNVLTVANVQEVENYVDASSVTINSSSSWGPTDDGRIKPDISAKGTQTLSSASVADNVYGTATGTSMATPSVTGSIALLQEHYQNLNASFMKASTAKALVIHSAREAGDAPGPDYKYGWGLMDTAESANLITSNGFTSIVEENTLTENSTYTLEVEALNPDEELIATLVWTDLAGSTQGPDDKDDRTPRLVNDLDMKITGPDETSHFPWKLDVSNPSAPATQDVNDVDNVEKIQIPNAEGTYTIEITHKNVLTNNSQDFSLVVSGIAASNFNITSPVFSETFCANEAFASYDIKLETLEGFNDDVNFEVLDLPEELNPSFSDEILNEEGSTLLSIENLDQLTGGVYPFKITATSGSESKTLNLELNLLNTEPIDDVVLLSPMNEEARQDLTPTFSWEEISGNGISYEIQISEEASFNNIVFQETTTANEYKLNQKLEENQEYYWRVKAKNVCSESPYSSSSFSTSALACLPKEEAQDTPITIDEESPNTQVSIINFPEYFEELSVQDVKVSVKIDHTWVSDLIVSLVSPEGTSIRLLNRPCNFGQGYEDIELIFDDSGAQFTCEQNVTPTLSGTVRPQFGSLAEFIGENPAGDWKLEVQDIFEDDGGAINSFALEICYKKVTNDDACEATPLAVDAQSLGDAFSLVGATAQDNEPDTNFEDGIQGSVWFSFEAPTTGSVKITTDIEGGSLEDSELAVYSFTDCTDFTTFEQLGYDKNSGTDVASKNLSELNLHGLNPGETYYIQVDRTAIAEPGTFGIEVLTENLSNISFEDADFIIYPNPSKNGSFTIQARALIGSNTTVEMYSPLGKKVMSRQAQVTPNGTINVSASNLSSGLYIVKLIQNANQYTTKILMD